MIHLLHIYPAHITTLTALIDNSGKALVIAISQFYQFFFQYWNISFTFSISSIIDSTPNTYLNVSLGSIQ